QLPGVSDNIRAISIIDRFLEHARVYIFANNGENQVIISSADWMTRNIDYRIEVGVIIYDPELKQQLIDIMEIQFSDNVKARYLDKELSNWYVPCGRKPRIRSQMAIYDYLKNLQQQRD
ncbi:MAG: polyphosphate kinase 1, partial [Enterobacteriaceae bacterium]